MRRSLYGVLLLILLLPILAACGGGTTGNNTATTGPASSPAGTEASPSPFTTETTASAAPQATTGATMAAETATTAGEAMTPATDETATGASGNASNIRIALVTDVGKINDGTFNQFAYEGLQRAQSELGVKVDYIETQQPTDYEKNLEQFASQKYDLVIGVGFLMGDAIKAIASRYPDIKFAIVDAAPEGAPANVKPLLFKEDQAGYIVGTMAALLTKSNTIGVVGGVEQVPAVQRFVKGYEAGAKAQKSDINVRQVYLPSFTDPAAGGEAARSQIAEGADVIFGAGGQTGSGAIQAAAQEGVFVIGVDQDEYNTTFKKGSGQGADKLVTSAIKRVDNAVFDTIKSIVDGNFSSEQYIGDAANGGVDYSDAHDASSAVTAEIKAKVDEVKKGLADGTIKTGVELQ
jgi:basic membrane protein A